MGSKNYMPTGAILSDDADGVLVDLGVRQSAAPRPHKSSGLANQRTPIPCPCCGHQIVAPTLEQVVYHYKIAPQAERILGAVWAGRGLPVSTQRIFDAMWFDDIDGGPPEARMYNNFKWSMNDLRNRLRGSGIGVESAGYNAGYRLVMGVAQKEK